MTTDPADAVAAVALASLGLSPGRLRRLVAGHGPVVAWELLRAGTHPGDPDRALAATARRVDPGAAHSRCAGSGVRVLVRGEQPYPACLVGDAEAPAFLFATGEPAVLARELRVAVVGTRSATTTGRETAFALGAGLARAGAVVVSGLALGIDAAAHQGTLAEGGTAVAVLGTGHDAPSAPVQERLRAEMSRTGAVLSELPPGAPGARWRFAVRNRIMAALAQVVVVVECHGDGGAMHTVRAARRRGIPVAAVPGSVRSAASVGTNELIVAGAPAVRDAADVLALLGWGAPVAPTLPGLVTSSPAPGAPLPPDAQRLLGVLEDQPLGLESIVRASGLSVPAAALALEQLSEQGLAAPEAGCWRRTAALAGRRR